MTDFVAQTVGIEKHIRRLKQFREAAEPAAHRAAVKAAEILLEEANKICPVDTGDLRDSGHVVVEGEGFSTEATVIYDAEYAIYVHENLDAYHAPPTQAKWLEETLRQYRGSISSMIRQEVKDAINEARG